MYNYQFKFNADFMNGEVTVIQAKAGALHLSQLTTEVGEESPALKSLTNMYEAFYNVMNAYADALWNDLRMVSDISVAFTDMDRSMTSFFTNPGAFGRNTWPAFQNYNSGLNGSVWGSPAVYGSMSAASPVVVPGRTG